MLFATSLIVLGIIGLYLAHIEASDSLYVLWACALLAVNIWMTEHAKKTQRRNSTSENSGPR